MKYIYIYLYIYIFIFIYSAQFILKQIIYSPDQMGNIMYISFSIKDKGWVRFFWVYKFYSFYIYMIIVTIFATLNFDAPFVPNPSQRSEIILETKSGFGILIYTWITAFVWPFVLWAIVIHEKAIDANIFELSDFNITSRDGVSTSRDLIVYIYNHRFEEASQLLKFGYIIPDGYVDHEVK